MRQVHPAAIDEFKNAYNVEFLGLAVDHSEADLHGALLRNLGRFLTELSGDFCFVGSQYPVQVGNQDFAIDLVFFHHRGLHRAHEPLRLARRSCDEVPFMSVSADATLGERPRPSLVARDGAGAERARPSAPAQTRPAGLRTVGREGPAPVEE